MFDGTLEIIKNDISLFLKDHMTDLEGAEDRFTLWLKTLMAGHMNGFTRYYVFDKLGTAYREYQNYLSIKNDYDRMMKRCETVNFLIVCINYIELKLKGETDESFW